MRHAHLSFLLVALVCTGGPAVAQSDGAATKKKEKVVCRTEEVVGSRRPKRVCMTQAQWDGITQDSRDALRTMDARSGSNQPQ